MGCLNSTVRNGECELGDALISSSTTYGALEKPHFVKTGQTLHFCRTIFDSVCLRTCSLEHHVWTCPNSDISTCTIFNCDITHYPKRFEIKICQYPFYPYLGITVYNSRRGDQTPRVYSTQSHQIWRDLSNRLYSKNNYVFFFFIINWQITI